MLGPIVSRPVTLGRRYPDVREPMAALLEVFRYRVVCAPDGEALTMLQVGLDPCTILLDLHMPVMDGFQFRAEQLKSQRLAEIPTLVFSGAYDVKRAASLMEVRDYLQKPVDPVK
jgi:CheY-like chemotaxis protein